MQQQTDPFTLTSLSFTAQGIEALVFASILIGFYRIYRRDYLKDWACSWAAFFFYLVGGAVTFYAHQAGFAPDHLVRRISSSISLVGGYWQIAWLLFGTLELLSVRTVGRAARHWLLGGLAVIAVAVVLWTAPLIDVAFVTLLRMGPRSLAAGLSCLVAAYSVWHLTPRPLGLGRRIVVISFLLFGLQQLGIAGLVWQRWEPTRLATYLNYFGPFDLLFYGLIGFSMVVWLHEEERERSTSASAQLEHLAYHDSLTGLPNRNGLVRRIRPALEEARRQGHGLAVILLDLDHFKLINDSLGHAQGNDLLQELARRMRAVLPDEDDLAHLGGDEFAILLPRVTSDAALRQTAESFLSIVRRPFDAEGRELPITASLGISRYPEDGSDAEELLKCADIAMYQAKQLGRDHLQLYAPNMDVGNLEQLSLAHDLRTALAEGRELMLYFQPILDTHTRRIEAFEGLLRWQHPRRGLLNPADFLPLAESTGLSEPLDLWVLREACRNAKEWSREGLHQLRVAVNLSARPFQRPDLLDRVHEVLTEVGLPAALLELEITENLAMQDADASLAVLEQLKELGVRITIDDFGTGYSSLSYLTNFPINTLKVDKAFTRSLGSGRGSEEVIAAVIALAHSLDIDVVAEGVELEEQWQILREQGCDKVQGFLFSRPVPAPECHRLLAEERKMMVVPVK